MHATSFLNYDKKLRYLPVKAAEEYAACPKSMVENIVLSVMDGLVHIDFPAKLMSPVKHGPISHTRRGISYAPPWLYDGATVDVVLPRIWGMGHEYYPIERVWRLFSDHAHGRGL